MDIVGAVAIVVGTGLIALAITRDLVFVIPFGIVFGLLAAISGWQGVKRGLEMNRPKA